MPRLQPPPGYLTASQAADILEVSEALLSRYVIQKKLHRYGPEERKHKFYKLSEVEALKASERVFNEPYKRGMWRLNPTSSFEVARESDMDRIVEISRGIFGDPVIPASTRLEWQRKNRETFYILRNAKDVTVGYASLLPLSKTTIDRFVHDDLQAEEIRFEDVEEYTPDRPIYLYVMAMGIDPSLTQAEKHEYGARLVAGLFALLLDLAQRGIEIETITARSHKPDGLRLLRKLGIPQLKSPVPGKSLFVVQVAESGFHIFDRYNELLNTWKAQHATPVTAAPARPQSAPRSRPVASSRPATSEAGDELPGDLVGTAQFARLHAQAGRETQAERAIQTERDSGRLPVVRGRWKVGRAIVQTALDQAGRARFYVLLSEREWFAACPDCPHLEP